MHIKRLVLYFFCLTVLASFLSGCGAAEPLPTATALLPTITPNPPTDTPTLLPPTDTPTPIPPTQTPTLPPVCQSLESQEAPPDLSARDVVTEMVVQLNGGDIPGAMAYFAADTHGYIFGLPPAGFSFISGKEENCRAWVNAVDDNLEWEVTILSAVNWSNGVLVTSKSKIWLDFYRQLEVAPIEIFNKFVVVDGKITEYSTWLKQESLAALRPVWKDILPSTVTSPDTSMETPGSEITMVFSDYACTYEGPVVWKSGEFDFTIDVKDQDEIQEGFVLISLDEGYDFFDLAVASVGDRPPWVRYSIIFDLGLWGTETVQHTVAGNRQYLMCFGAKLDTAPIGLFGPFETRP